MKAKDSQGLVHIVETEPKGVVLSWTRCGVEFSFKAEMRDERFPHMRIPKMFHTRLSPNCFGCFITPKDTFP